MENFAKMVSDFLKKVERVKNYFQRSKQSFQKINYFFCRKQLLKIEKVIVFIAKQFQEFKSIFWALFSWKKGVVFY